MQILRANKKTHYTVLLAILVLSSYVHLWNPAGFPDIFFDEGIYMRRAMTMLETGNPQEALFYDHPYFGQMILAGFIKLVGFPETVERQLDASYLLPRILMGLFAILDTFLIYKISEKRFGRRVAILSSILFAVMPVTWMFRRILLDTVLMPFLLSSILLALYSRDAKHPAVLIAGSSILLGLAIFTKITAVTMIPVVAYVVVSGHRLRSLVQWLPPMFAIPMIWPGVAMYLGHLDLWFQGIFWQARRGTGQLWPVTGYVFSFDPVLVGLGFVGFAHAIFRRNLFLMFWFAPFLLFVSTVGFFQYFHYILIIPVMCVAIGVMLDELLHKVRRAKMQNALYVTTFLGFAVYGGMISGIVISHDLTSQQFAAIQYTVDTFDDRDFTLISSPVYSWILSDVYERDNIFLDYGDILDYEPKTRYQYLIVDNHFLLDQSRGDKIVQVLEDSRSIKSFVLTDLPDANKFPFQILTFTNEGTFVDIRTDKTGP